MIRPGAAERGVAPARVVERLDAAEDRQPRLVNLTGPPRVPARMRRTSSRASPCWPRSAAMSREHVAPAPAKSAGPIVATPTLRRRSRSAPSVASFVLGTTLLVAAAVAGHSEASHPRTPSLGSLQAGGTLLVHRGDGGHRSLFSVRADGSDVRFLASGVQGAWSHDGSALAVVRPQEGVMKIFIGTRSGGQWRFRPLLPGSRRHELGPAWSSDGERLAFSRSRASVPASQRVVDLSASPLDIWLAAPSGRSLRGLAGGTRPALRSFSPSWSPDGRQIAFTTEPQRPFTGVHRGEQIHVMRSDGSQRRTLTPPGASEFVTRQAWSPDGDQLVFMRRHAGIWVMQPDGSERRRLSGSGADLYPFWSPHGGLIAFTRHAEGAPHVHVMNADGTNRRSVTSGVVEQWKPTR